MFPTSIDRLRRQIASFKDGNPRLTSQMEDRIRTLQMELGFLKTFIWCSPHGSLRKTCIDAAILLGKRKLRLRGLDRAVSGLLQEVELCKLKMREDCLHLLDFSNQCKFSSSYELLQFINCTLGNLRNLVHLNAGPVVSVRLQVKALIQKLEMFRDFVNATGEQFFFGIDIQVWASKITFLSVLCWVDHMEGAMAARVKAILFDPMVNSYSPEFLALYLGVLKASKVASSPKFVGLYLGVQKASEASFDRIEMGKFIESFVRSILPLEYMNTIGAELMFLIACVLDPPKWEMDAEEGNLISTKAKTVACEIHSLICSLTVGEIDKNIVKERNVILGDFRGKTDKIKAEVRQFYVQILESSGDRSPFTNALAFIDSPLDGFENLKETLISKAIHIPFSKDQFLTLHKELVALGPFLKKVYELQNELEELMDLWMRISQVAYRVEYVVDSFLMKHIPIWCNVIFLSDVIEEVKFIKGEILEIKHKQRPTNRILNANVNFGNIHLRRGPIDDVVIGFKDEAEKIIDRLTGGLEKLDIVSIVGMPGQGKTTLAKKVYNSTLVRRHFNKYAWCYVTQVYEDKMLLLDILKDVTTLLDDEIYNISKEDLAQKLYRCLKGQRYLIIMDDIWDVTAWNALKESFPDDNNGSRIMFTSRNKFGCDPHLLRLLSEKESMELLKHKLFLKDGWPSNFSRDVQKILKICNGLPLAVVVVAGLLRSASNNLDQWRELVQNLDSKLASEGCMDILELSYNNLPVFLRPCFLYLGAVVKQRKVFKVQKLIQLWIAEGFVQKSGIKSLEDVAIEYLEDLIGRSLVIVNKRNFTNGQIKECCIHDLLHELCLRKAEEERLMYFLNIGPYSLKPINCEAHCLRIYSEWMANAWHENAGQIVRLVPPKITSPIVHSLFFPPGKRFPDCLIFDFFSRLKFVRVLDMWRVELGNCFPKEIASLICLRYLAIWISKPFIPSSIENLCNLESFCLRCYYTIDFPGTTWKMKTLRNINVIGCGVNMVSDATPCSRLDNLDCFSSLRLCHVEDAENLLRGFPRVRKLKLQFSEFWQCRRDCDQFEMLHFLSKLESLKLKYSSQVVHTCAFNFPTTLKKLSLSFFSHPLSKISTIGKLLNLEVLKLCYPKNQAESWDVGDEEFLNLKHLKVIGFCISCWEVSASSFACLDRLVVRDCSCLDELPSIFDQVMTLKLIELRWCRKSLGTSAMSILSAQRDIGNEELEVHISDALEEKTTKMERKAQCCKFFEAAENKHKQGKFGVVNISMWQNVPCRIEALTSSDVFGQFTTWRDFRKFTTRPNRYKLRKFKNSNFLRLYLRRGHYKNRLLDKRVAYKTYDVQRALASKILDVQKAFGLEKKDIMQGSVACFQKGHVPSTRRMNPTSKHNCQPRQAILSRHNIEELKRG